MSLLKTTAVALLLITASAQAQDWKKSIKDAAKAQGQQQLESRLGLPKAAPPGAVVYFINLKDGDTVASPVLIQFGLKSAGVAPAGTTIEGTGHHHLLIDDPQVDYAVAMPATEQIKHFGGGQTETSLALKPGKHTLQLVFADYKHQAFNPSVQSAKISVTVK